MANETFWAAGGASAVAAAIASYFTYRQATKVAKTQAEAEGEKAQAQIGIKRLENESARENLWHGDFVAERNRADELAKQLQEAQRCQFKAEAQLDVCKGEKDDWEKEKAAYRAEIAALKEEVSLSNHRSNSLEQRLQGVAFMEEAMKDPIRLVQLLTAAMGRLDLTQDPPVPREGPSRPRLEEPSAPPWEQQEKA